MSPKDDSIKVKCTIQVPARDVYDAFTHAAALTEWLCNVAEADARPAGRMYLWWNSGYYSSGEFTSLVPGERIAFSWHGRNEPGITQVKINLKEVEPGVTRVGLSHTHFGDGKTWKDARREFRKGWKASLENLQSVLETGMDLRFVRRPLFGLSGAEVLDAEKTAALGLPVKGGLQIDGLVPGMGAAGAGLQSGDVLVRLSGKKITGYDSLTTALQRHHAGDVVKAVYYRGVEKNNVKVTLAARPLPEIPFSAEGLADAVEKNQHMLNLEMEVALEGIRQEDADHKPAPAEWSINENLAHLVAGERDLQSWITSLIEGRDNANIFHTNQNARLEAMLSAIPKVKDLLKEYKRSQVETLALLRRLPLELAARKGAFWQLGYNLLTLPDHTREHVNHIQKLRREAEQAAAVEAVTETVSEP